MPSTQRGPLVVLHHAAQARISLQEHTFRRGVQVRTVRHVHAGLGASAPHVAKESGPRHYPSSNPARRVAAMSDTGRMSADCIAKRFSARLVAASDNKCCQLGSL
jgi:hypothetical protein